MTSINICHCCGQPLTGRKPISISETSGEACLDGKAVALAPSQRRLVNELRRAMPGLVSEADLQRRVLGQSKASIRTLIHQTRTKLRRIGADIINVPRQGYRLSKVVA